MPHIIVKLWPGREESQKQALAQRIAEDVTQTLGASPESISVSIEEIPQEDWPREVFRPDIIEKPESLYIKPGYTCDISET